MNSKIITVIAIVAAVAVIGAAAYFLTKPAPGPSQQSVSQPQTNTAVNNAPSGTATFNTNDNLDQAIQDLNTVEQ